MSRVRSHEVSTSPPPSPAFQSMWSLSSSSAQVLSLRRLGSGQARWKPFFPLASHLHPNPHPPCIYGYKPSVPFSFGTPSHRPRAPEGRRMAALTPRPAPTAPPPIAGLAAPSPVRLPARLSFTSKAAAKIPPLSPLQPFCKEIEMERFPSPKTGSAGKKGNASW